MPKVFFVRSYYREFTPQFITGRYVAIGWLKKTDLSKVKSREEIYSLYRQEHPEEKNNYSIGQEVGQIRTFLNGIKKGDYVITQANNNSHIHYGIITSRYYYEPDSKDGCDFSHRKSVHWIAEIPRAKFSQAIRNTLGSNLTVFSVSQVDDFIKVVDKYELHITEESVTGKEDGNVRFNFTQSFEESTDEEREIDKKIVHAKDFVKEKAKFITQDITQYSEKDKDDQGGAIELFYGTNRVKVMSHNQPKYIEGSEKLRFGKCLVSIPRGHKQGKLRSLESISVLDLPKWISKGITLQDIKEESDKDVFYADLRKKINEPNKKAALIFIHGFDNSFSDAAERTAQIVWDVSFKGIAGFYSWPSNGSISQYEDDEKMVKSSEPFFAEFILDFIQKTQVETLHLIAHSMGNQLMTTTLNNLSLSTARHWLKAIHQIILAAPDIDKKDFENNIFPTFKNIGVQRTLYSSDRDLAYVASEKLMGRKPRLGQAKGDLFVSNEIDTVNASNVSDKGTNHSYLFKTKPCINDMYHILRNELPPSNRNLQERMKENYTYWLFPK